MRQFFGISKIVAMIVACAAASASACSFVTWVGYQYDTLAPGEVRVVKVTSGEDMLGKSFTRTDTVGISRLTEFQSHVQGFLNDSALVFVGQIDSVIQSAQDTTVSGLTSVYDLGAGQLGDVRFYARLKIDTVLKGTLASKLFWVKGWAANSGICGMPPSAHKNRVFLNVSNGLTARSDLKLPWGLTNEYGRPTAHWFDGRYLESPNFPGLKLDITQVLPGYPATGVVTRRLPTFQNRPEGKAYRPDGRVVPENAKRGKNPAPVLKQAP